MPALSLEEFDKLLDEIAGNAIPLSININERDEARAIKESESYLNDRSVDVSGMIPLTYYHIISKLTEEEQITFIKENIDYIKKHHNDIFLYTLMSPNSLSYYLSFNVLKELKKIDYEIFFNILSGNAENLFNGFREEDYFTFYNEFYEDLNKLDNKDFIDLLYFHNRCLYDIGIEDINKIFDLQRVCNKEFMIYLLDKYKDKIKSFNPNNALSFITYIEDEELYKEFIKDNYDKLNKAFLEISEFNLIDYLSETDSVKQEILITNFFENIIGKQDIKKIIYKLSYSNVLKLYKENKCVFSELSLKDWILVSSRLRQFTSDFKDILDCFEIKNIEELFDTRAYRTGYFLEDVKALKYIELKYRSSLKTSGKVEDIDENTSVFSSTYLANLNELRELLINNKISKSDEVYKKHLTNFILFLKKEDIITDIDNSNFKEIEVLFNRIVMGKSITILYELTNIKDITIYNRLGKLDFYVGCFSIDQLERYNVKQHKQLCNIACHDDWQERCYKNLNLKLLLLLGFNNAKNLLEIDSDFPMLEHLVGNVDVSGIKLDEFGNPILNNKIMNLLFSNKSTIEEMLKDKDNDLYKFFPRIFNEWEMICINDKDKSLKTIIDFLKSDEISLPVKYYRLEGLFKYIGCGNNIVNETLLLHDEILKRVSSSIPKITGEYEDYTYEVLDLHDMNGLAVGNITDCCFTVLGNGYPCLKHAMTSANGRILVIKKDGEVIAHSWLWRNGDLLCLDNIEISKKIDNVDFFDLYLDFADKVVSTSFENEGMDSCIKNVTVGFTNFDKEIKGIEDYPCLISKACDLEKKDFGSRLGNKRKFVDTLPSPVEEVGYRDSKNVQYLIKGSGNFHLGEVYPCYMDNRSSVLTYTSSEDYSSDYLELINQKLNALRYLKAEKENKLDKFKPVEVDDYLDVVCGDDWFRITDYLGEVHSYINSCDNRAYLELESINYEKAKVLRKI